MHKKLLVIVLSLFFVLGTIGLASANGEGGGGGDKLTIKDNNVLIGKGNTGIQGNKNHHNVVIGGDVNLGTNAGGRITNRNSNTNENSNTNTNTNTNLNLNLNKQNQKQGQQQGQEQSLTNDIKIEGDTYEAAKMHINGPGFNNTEINHQQGKRFTYKTWGSVWDRVDFLTYKQAKTLGKNVSDVEVEVSVMFENDFRTAHINKGKAGDFMGYLYVGSDGDDTNAAGMEGKAAKKAMELGATHMVKRLDTGDVADGEALNIGLSGGASIIPGDNGSVAIAPNGGLGWGTASSTNETRPAMVFELYVDPSVIKEKLSKRKDDQSYMVSDR